MKYKVPSPREIRKSFQKSSYSFIEYHIHRRISPYFTWFFLHFTLTAELITLLTPLNDLITIYLINDSLPYTFWADNALSTNKAVTLVSYLIDILSLFFYVLVVFFVCHRLQKRIVKDAQSKIWPRLLFYFVLVSNIFFLCAFSLVANIYLLACFFTMWLMLLLFPLPIFHTVIRSPGYTKSLRSQKFFDTSIHDHHLFYDYRILAKK